MTGAVAIESCSKDPPLINMDSPQASDTPSAVDNRVFFGPLQSPEKKFALSLSGPKFRTPVRRSTRLLPAMVPLPLFSEEQESGPSSTREGTPEEDTIPDEPSVILASRVLSACSNPSPPPSSPLLAKDTLSERNEIQPFDLFVPPQPFNALSNPLDGPLIPLDDLTEPIPTSSPFLPRVSTPVQQHTTQANSSQPDLIVFDSFSTPNASHINALSGRAPLHDIPTQSTTPSVDDLLAISPGSSRPAVHGQQTNVSEHSERRSPTVTPDEGMEVALPSEEETAFKSTSSAEETSLPKEETLPLRRSSRPRKSRSSLPLTIVSVFPQPSIPKEQPPESEGAVAEESDEQRSTQRKRKLRPSPKPEDKGEGTSVDVLTSPKRLPQVAHFHRELGSLSPMSTAVLSQLYANVSTGSARSSTPLPPPVDGAPQPGNAVAPAPKTPPQQSPAFIFPNIGPNGEPPLGAQRPRSPLRPFTPFKFGEGSRTPARRVPIAQAVAEGTYSPNKLPAAFGASRPTNAPCSPVFKKLALDDPLRSPAKRVPMNEAVPVPPPSPRKTLDKGKRKAIPHLQSPIRASSVPPRDRERSTSVEPQPLRRRERGASAEPASRPPALGRRPLLQKPASSDGIPGSAVKPHGALPFSFIPGQQQRVPSIPEGDESGLSTSHLAPREAGGAGSRGTSAAAASPAKQGSSLRQPSAGSGSKIPRIGAKPYARPRSATSAEAPTKFPLSTKSSLSSSKTKPLRIVQIGSSSGSSSDEGPASSNTLAVIPGPILKPGRAPGVQPSASSVEPAPATGSKRKREMEPSSKKLSAPASQQKVIMRKVVPGMFNKGKETANAVPAVEHATPVLSSPTKVPGPMKARSAVGWKRPQQEPVQPQPPPSAAVPVNTTISPIAPKEPSPEPALPSATLIMKVEPGKPVPELNPPTPAPPNVTTETAPNIVPPAPSPSAEPIAEPALRQPTTRRSTRARRGTTAAIDVFGSVTAMASAHTTQRRRGPLPSETSGPFVGMSALALKTLTSTNTTRNQQQVAKIQTEVVRKEGNRPDSPTTRVRSALEQQKEARVQQRQERAERRARRSASSDPQLETGGADGEGDKNGDGVSDVSAMSVDEEGLPLRHRRGPGDEEDYETPPRPDRPIKRLRLDGGEDPEDEGERTRDVLAKRVKWDKGLHTTVFLDDTPPKPKWDTNAVPNSKSCLTPAAKALRLDTLGNVLNAEIPVTGLVKESIVVKKFVFDDDELPEKVVPPSTPAVKSTRSKSRKAKS